MHLCDTLTLEDFRREPLWALHHNERNHSLQRQTRRAGMGSRRGRRERRDDGAIRCARAGHYLVMAWNIHEMGNRDRAVSIVIGSVFVDFSCLCTILQKWMSKHPQGRSFERTLGHVDMLI